MPASRVEMQSYLEYGTIESLPIPDYGNILSLPMLCRVSASWWWELQIAGVGMHHRLSGEPASDFNLAFAGCGWETRLEEKLTPYFFWAHTLGLARFCS